MNGYTIIILVYVMLAILSRKNYSKYKGEKYGYVVGVFYAIAEKVYVIAEKYIDIDSFRFRFRKLFVASSRGIYALTKDFFVKAIGTTLGIFLVFDLMALCLHMVNLNVKETNIIEREEYQGNTKEMMIKLSDEGEEYQYNLMVNPMEYTKEEFDIISEDVFAELESEILGDNDNLKSVKYDLILPTVSSTGEFSIEWSSSDTFIMTAYGKIMADKRELPASVNMTATVKYLSFEKSHVYEIFICQDDNQNEKIEMAKEELKELENENRNDKRIYLPDEVNGVLVKKVQNKQNAFSLIGLGIVISISFMFISVEKLKDKLKQRDKELINCYPGFVNKLWLLIGTGMTVKDAFIKIIKENRKRDLLTREMEYAINQINSGYSEIKAYEELGIRIGLAPYMRLMNRISQNIKKGSKDLRKLMEEEVYLSLNERKELVRKKGEEASTKLLIPMVLLLGIVMVVVMFPAMINF